jgi:hypothetical protein
MPGPTPAAQPGCRVGPARPTTVPGVSEVPADVVISRAVRASMRALLLLAAMCVVLALVGVAGAAMADDGRASPLVSAGLTLIGVGAMFGLLATAIAGVALVSVLRPVGQPGSPESQVAARADRPRDAVRTLARRLAILMRVVLGACVLAIAVWGIADPEGIVGAVVGALVTVQLVVVMALLRVHLLRSI